MDLLISLSLSLSLSLFLLLSISGCGCSVVIEVLVAMLVPRFPSGWWTKYECHWVIQSSIRQSCLLFEQRTEQVSDWYDMRRPGQMDPGRFKQGWSLTATVNQWILNDMCWKQANMYI